MKEVVDTGIGLEGLIRQDSKHAAAVVISPEPLTEFLPIQRKPEKGIPAELAPIVTQYDMHGVEMLGLLKMDLLGLRTLSVIDEAVRLIRSSHDPAFDIDTIPLDDSLTFDLLRAGDSLGLFQIESSMFQELLHELAPTSFEDVGALVALCRPGPMAADMHHAYAARKNGREPPEPPHPDLAELLEETYGLMIYQESMMRVAQQIAGYSMPDADDLRKACGKKQRDRIMSHRRKFIDGSVAEGYSAELGEQIFDTIEPFADYAFNKSHAFAYGLVTYQTAFLKANYPAEFFAATLTGSKRNLEKAGVYLADCRAHDIKVSTPDVNTSDVDFGVIDNVITFGLSAIRHVGGQAAAGIVAARSADGPFKDFTDFCERAPRQIVNKRSIESLIKSGAFESCGHARLGLLDVHEQIISSAHRRAAEAEAGMQSLFGEADSSAVSTIAVPGHEADDGTRLEWERELLGLYVSGHPLSSYEAALASSTDCAIGELAENADASSSIGQPHEEYDQQPDITVGGIIRDVDQRLTRNGELMARFTLADEHHSTRVTVFPKVLERCGPVVEDNRVVLVSGRVEQHPDFEASFIANRVEELEQVDGSTDQSEPSRSAEQVAEAAPATQPLILDLNNVDPTPEWLDRFEQVMAEFPGDDEVRVTIGSRAVVLPARVSSAEAFAPLNALLIVS